MGKWLAMKGNCPQVLRKSEELRIGVRIEKKGMELKKKEGNAIETFFR